MVLSSDERLELKCFFLCGCEQLMNYFGGVSLLDK